MSPDRTHTTLRAIMLRYRLASAGVVATLFVLIVFMAATAISSSKRPPLSDASSCSEWGAATQAQQYAYSQLYVNEHGPAAGGDAASVGSTISSACIRSAYLGESDDVTVVAAVKHEF